MMILTFICGMGIWLLRIWVPVIRGASWRGIDGAVRGVDVAVTVMILGVLTYGVFFLRSVHNVYLTASSLRVEGPRVNAVVPLTLVQEVVFLDTRYTFYYGDMIALYFSWRSRINGAIRFLPATLPGQSAKAFAEELSQMVKTAKSASV